MVLNDSESTHTTIFTVEGANEVNSQLDGITNRLFSIQGAAIAAGVALGVMSKRALTDSIRAFGEFEDVMVEVEKVTNEAIADEVQADILELSQSIPLTTTELGQMAATAGRMGLALDGGSESVREFTETVAKMSIATDLSADESAQALGKLINQLDLTTDETENLGSAINFLSNTTRASTSEIVDSLLRSATAGKQLGLQTSEILRFNASVAALSESAERGGTRLRRLFEQLSDPRVMEKFNESFGITTEQFRAIRNEAPNDLIRALAMIFQDTSEEAQLAQEQLGLIFSTESLQALRILAADMEDLSDDKLAEVAESFEEATSLQEEFEKASRTLNAQLTILRNRLNKIFIEIGQFLAPKLVSVLEIMTAWVKIFDKVNVATGGAFGTIILLIGAIGGLALAVDAFLKLFRLGGLIGFLTKLANNPIFQAITLLVAGLLLLGKAYEENLFGFRDAVDSVAGFVVDKVGAMSEAFGMLRQRLVDLNEATGGKFKIFKNALIVFSGLSFATIGFIKLIKALGGLLLGFLATSAKEAKLFGSIFFGAFNSAKIAILKFLQTIGVRAKVIDSIIQKGFIGTIRAWIAANGGLVASLKVVGARMVSLARAFGPITIALGLLLTAWLTNWGRVRDFTEAVLGQIRNVLSGMVGFLLEIPDIVGEAIGGLAQQLLMDLGLTEEEAMSITREIGQAFINLAETIVRVVATVAGALMLANEAVSDFVGIFVGGAADIINSPLVDFLGTGIAEIVRAGFDTLFFVIEVALGSIITLFRVTWSVINGDTDDALDILTGFVDRKLQRLVGLGEKWVGRFVDKVVPKFEELVEFIEDKFAFIFDPLVEAFEGAIDYIENSGSQFETAVRVVIRALTSPFVFFGEWLIFGSFIPDLFETTAEYIETIGANLLANAIGAVVQRMQDSFSTLNLTATVGREMEDDDDSGGIFQSVGNAVRGFFDDEGDDIQNLPAVDPLFDRELIDAQAEIASQYDENLRNANTRLERIFDQNNQAVDPQFDRELARAAGLPVIGELKEVADSLKAQDFGITDERLQNQFRAAQRNFNRSGQTSRDVSVLNENIKILVEGQRAMNKFQKEQNIAENAAQQSRLAFKDAQERNVEATKEVARQLETFEIAGDIAESIGEKVTPLAESLRDFGSVATDAITSTLDFQGAVSSRATGDEGVGAGFRFGEILLDPGEVRDVLGKQLVSVSQSFGLSLKERANSLFFDPNAPLPKDIADALRNAAIAKAAGVNLISLIDNVGGAQEAVQEGLARFSEAVKSTGLTFVDSGRELTAFLEGQVIGQFGEEFTSGTFARLIEEGFSFGEALSLSELFEREGSFASALVSAGLSADERREFSRAFTQTGQQGISESVMADILAAAGPAVNIGEVTVIADDAEGGRRAGEEFANELNSRFGLQVRT